MGSKPAACKPDITTSLLKGKKLPARKAETLKANAEGLQSQLKAAGHNAQIVFNSDRNLYRVVAATFATESTRVLPLVKEANFKAFSFASAPELMRKN